jgi:3D (Asp-Asp-Asp) domain-containing protein
LQAMPQKSTFVLDSFLEKYDSFRFRVRDTQIRDSFTQIVEFTATAYDLSYECCGKYPSDPAFGITFSGAKATRGRTIAVDPQVIPINSSVYIQFPSPYTRLNGWYVAEDTGSRVKGKIIDIFFGRSAFAEARKFGRRTVSVRIIPSGEQGED